MDRMLGWIHISIITACAHGKLLRFMRARPSLPRFPFPLLTLPLLHALVSVALLPTRRGLRCCPRWRSMRLSWSCTCDGGVQYRTLYHCFVRAQFALPTP